MQPVNGQQPKVAAAVHITIDEAGNYSKHFSAKAHLPTMVGLVQGVLAQLTAQMLASEQAAMAAQQQKKILMNDGTPAPPQLFS